MNDKPKDRLTVVISSTVRDLPEHREEVMRGCRQKGHYPEMMEHLPAADADAINESLALVDEADVYVGIFAHRYGFVPPGSDMSITEMEYRRAKERGVPRLVFFMHEDHPLKASDFETGEGAIRLARLKDEIGVERVVAFFKSPADLRAHVLHALDAQEKRPRSAARQPATKRPEVRLHRWPKLDLPPDPYPLLLPYSHPALFAGRARELAELRALLRGEVPIVLLHAPSGAGKSSLLRAGLAPALGDEHVPVALDDRPTEAGLGRRLITGLLASDEWAGDEGPPIEPTDVDAFVDYLRQVRQIAHKTPVLLVDQFEELFQRPQHRAVAGLLLAASLRHAPSVGAPPVRWVLAYRQEFHGDVRTWLGDVLADARRADLRGVDDLPHDLSTPRRSCDWALRPFGTPRPGEPGDAEAAFRAAIEAPLAAVGEDGKPRYSLRFAGDGAERLAAAFAESRDRNPEAPLVPELQVVLAKLRREASDGEVRVGDDPSRLIADALEDHLARAIDSFYVGRSSEAMREGRTRILLALHGLTDTQGKRGESLTAGELSERIGDDGAEVLKRLAESDVRVLVRLEKQDQVAYALSHDLMAEAVVRIVKRAGWHGQIELDRKLLSLPRFIHLNSQLFLSEPEQAIRIPNEQFKRIQANLNALIRTDAQRNWWQACVRRRGAERKFRRNISWALLLTFVGAIMWQWGRWGKDRETFLSRMGTGRPDETMAVLDLLRGNPRVKDIERHAALKKQQPDVLSLFEQGPAGLANEQRRAATIVEAAALLIPLVKSDPKGVIGAMAWALDYAEALDESLGAEVQTLKEQLLQPLGPRPPQTEFEWIEINAGSFVMGSEKGRGDPDEEPPHEVTVSKFWMLAHEVTNREFRLFKEHKGQDDLPAIKVDWYTAYAFAAWLGGRLPTEAEWEYAARAGCLYEYCDSQGEKTTLDRVGWFGNHPRFSESAPGLQPVRQLEPNPWGLYDMVGNALEWVADWDAEYSSETQVDPWGPPSGGIRVFRAGGFGYPTDRARAADRVWVAPGGYRVIRGGGYRYPAVWARATDRNRGDPGFVGDGLGFRVVLPAAPSH